MIIHIVQKSNHYRKIASKIVSRLPSACPAPSSVHTFITFLYRLLEFLMANTSQYKYTFCLHLFLSYISIVFYTRFFPPCLFHVSWQFFPISMLRAFSLLFFIIIFKKGHSTPLCGCTIIYLTDQSPADGHKLFSIISYSLQVMLQWIKLPFCTISEQV